MSYEERLKDAERHLANCKRDCHKCRKARLVIPPPDQPPDMTPMLVSDEKPKRTKKTKED